MDEVSLREGDVVQLSPDVANPLFAGSFMVVTDPKPWGAQGYVLVLGTNAQQSAQAFYRAKWEEMEYIGTAIWTVK